MNIFFFFNLIVSMALYLPFFLFLCLCAWSALIEKIRSVNGVEREVVEYMKERHQYLLWKRYKHDAEEYWNKEQNK